MYQKVYKNTSKRFKNEEEGEEEESVMVAE